MCEYARLLDRGWLLGARVPMHAPIRYSSLTVPCSTTFWLQKEACGEVLDMELLCFCAVFPQVKTAQWKSLDAWTDCNIELSISYLEQLNQVRSLLCQSITSMHRLHLSQGYLHVSHDVEDTQKAASQPASTFCGSLTAAIIQTPVKWRRHPFLSSSLRHLL